MPGFKRRFVRCVRNDEYLVSLQTRKIYEAFAGAEAVRHQQLRVIDESSEDYLYPKEHFDEVELDRVDAGD